jgi:hypothetical protein
MSEDYWKKPERPEGEAGEKAVDPGVGTWSRVRVFRIGTWILAIVVAILLALLATTYFSGFTSVFEMFSWLRESLG